MVNNSPRKAVAVNKDKFIFIFNIISYADIVCIRKYFYLMLNFEQKKGLTFARPGDGEPYF